MSRFCSTAGRTTLSITAALGLGMSWSSASLAQTNSIADAPQAQSQSGSQWSLGLGVITMQKPYKDIKRDNYVLPLATYENKWVSLGVPKADLKLYSTDSMSFRLRARYDGDGYNEDDSPFLSGMADRKSTIWVGGAFLWKNDLANVSIEVLHDALSYSKGTRAGIQIDHRFHFGSFGVTPRLGADWYDSKYVDYYYGVRASEATAMRSAYKGKSATAVEAGLRFDYSPSSHSTLFLDLGVKRYGSAITDSPIVEKSNQTTVGIGYLYRF